MDTNLHEPFEIHAVPQKMWKKISTSHGADQLM